MATTKIHPITTTVNASIKYVLNNEKTMNGTLVSAFGCDKETAIEDFNIILSDDRSTNRSVKAQHLIQSFKPGEVDVNTAHEIGVQLADNFLKGKHQYVIATHVDKHHIHNHIVFNNVSFLDFSNFQSKRKNIYILRELSDTLCRENGLSVIRDPDLNKKRLDPHYAKSKYKTSFRYYLKTDIDLVVQKALNYDDFIVQMKTIGYEINSQNKYTTLKHKYNGQKRPIRMERLGVNYSKAMIEYRINNEFVDLRKHEFKPLDNAWKKRVIDLTSDKKFQTEPGLRFWAIRQNNQAIIHTLNRMEQLGCGSYSQMQNYIEQLENIVRTDEMDIQELNVDINELKFLLSKAESHLTDFNLYYHAEELTGKEKEEFYAENKIDGDPFEKLETFKHDLLLKDYPLENGDDLKNIITFLNEEIETKREETKSLLQDQMNGMKLVKEMKHLSNNYDKFMNRSTRFEVNRYDQEKT